MVCQIGKNLYIVSARLLVRVIFWLREEVLVCKIGDLYIHVSFRRGLWLVLHIGLYRPKIANYPCSDNVREKLCEAVSSLPGDPSGGPGIRAIFCSVWISHSKQPTWILPFEKGGQDQSWLYLYRKRLPPLRVESKGYNSGSLLSTSSSPLRLVGSQGNTASFICKMQNTT